MLVLSVLPVMIGLRNLPGLRVLEFSPSTLVHAIFVWWLQSRPLTTTQTLRLKINHRRYCIQKGSIAHSDFMFLHMLKNRLQRRHLEGTSTSCGSVSTVQPPKAHQKLPPLTPWLPPCLTPQVWIPRPSSGPCASIMSSSF